MADKEKTFTYMSQDGVNAILSAMKNSNEKFEMSLNYRDLQTVVRALEFTYRDSVLSGEFDLSDRAGEIVSGIAETLGIEFV